MEHEKMIRTSTVLDRVLKIVQGIAVGCGIAIVICAVLVLILGERMIAESNDIDLGPVRLALAGSDLELLDPAAFKVNLAISLLVAVVALGIAWYAIRLIREVLAPMKEGRPFDRGVSGTVKKLAWLSLFGGIAVQVCELVSEIMELRAYNLSALFDPAVVTDIGFSHGIDLDFLVTTCILFLLSYVFRYGEELQRQSDETL